MTIQQISEDEYTRMKDQGIMDHQLADDYSNDVYFYHIVDQNKEVVLGIYKNNDGLRPVIRICGNKVYVGYGHCVDIIEQSTVHRCGHHIFDSLVYDLLVVSERIIAVLELDVVLFDAYGDILATYNMSDIVASYRICDNLLLVSTVDGKTFSTSV